MTNANANISFGTTFSWDGADIAELTSIGGVEITLDTVEVTSHESASSFREYLPTLFDSGEIAIEGNYYPGDTNGQAAMSTDFLAKSKKELILNPSDDAWSYTADGYITAYKVESMEIDGKQNFSATIKITGKATLAYSAASNATGLVFTGNVGGAMTMGPVFAAATYEYVAEGAGDATTTVTVTAASADTITVTFEGSSQEVATGVASSAITLNVDGRSVITVVVAETGKVSKTYTTWIIDS